MQQGKIWNAALLCCLWAAFIQEAHMSSKKTYHCEVPTISGIEVRFDFAPAQTYNIDWEEISRNPADGLTVQEMATLSFNDLVNRVGELNRQHEEENIIDVNAVVTVNHPSKPLTALEDQR